MKLSKPLPIINPWMKTNAKVKLTALGQIMVENVSNEWQNFCIVHGIQHEFNVPHNPQQNGVAERKNRTLLDASRSMLQVAGREHRFWQEAVATSCYLQNRSPHKALGLNTPYMVWSGHTPKFSNLTVFGSIAYSHIRQEKRKKLDPHAKKCIMVGYGESSGVKGYKLFDPSNQKFIFSRLVTFDEDALVEYECIMAVFTLSLWTVLAQALYKVTL